jgi:hypothetical protein
MKLYVSIILAIIIFPSMAIASEPLKPALIVRLKEGHMRTCIPEINRQAVSVGLSFSAASVESFCRCLGTFYFNELTTADFEEMKARGDLPERISTNRKKLQEYCSSLHLE